MYQTTYMNITVINTVCWRQKKGFLFSFAKHTKLQTAGSSLASANHHKSKPTSAFSNNDPYAALNTAEMSLCKLW